MEVTEKLTQMPSSWPPQGSPSVNFYPAITVTWLVKAESVLPSWADAVKGFFVAVPQIAHNSTAHTLQPLKPKRDWRD
jgi:hypothetical protein